ncbi:MAG: alpha/beta fold hydrolase [Mogibacterium sp.]|nr:alpha/beta fold hydrolase [Mogibacterium sp.]
MDKKTVEKKKAIRFFSVTMMVLLVCSILIWGFQTSWGKVHIERIYINSQDGTSVSSLIYIPENATDETPAPAAVIYHGRSNHAHSNDTWSMELARRGFVVLSPDLQGGGESDPDIDRGVQAITTAQYANNLSFVQKDSLNLVGYSAGTATVLQTYGAMPEKVNSVCMVFGPFMMQMAGGFDFVDAHFGLIKSTADQYDYHFIGDPDACLAATADMAGIDGLEPNKDYDRNGKLFRYAVIDGTLHQTGNISGATISEIVKFENDVVDTPVKLENTDLAWKPQQLISGIACIAMMFLLAALVNLLMQNEFFASAANAVPKGGTPRKGFKAWAIDLLFSLVIPALIFVHVSAYTIKWTGLGTKWVKILPSANLNGIMAWLVVLALIGIVRMIIKSAKAKKAGTPLTLGDYALGADGDTKIDWSKPAKGFLMALIVAVFVFTWLWLIEGFMGINYQVWNLSTYLKMSPMRIVRAIPYCLIIFFVMFVGNMSQRILPSTGNEKKDMWRAVIINTVLTASALFVLLLAQYGGSMLIGTGQTIIPQIDIYGTGQNTSSGSLDFAFGYCYMMGGTTGVVTYLYRKYGNIWVGVIPAAIFAGLVTLSGFTVLG